MKKILITAIVILSMVSYSHAQQYYQTGIGLRGGLSQGLTVKHFISEQAAIEGILTTRWKGINITGLYELHAPAFDVDRLNYYYGFGGHIGFWDSKNNLGWGDDYNDGQYTVIGIDGILGLEYNFAEAPVNLSVDWKPAFNLSGHTGFWGDEAALSIRYIF